MAMLYKLWYLIIGMSEATVSAIIGGAVGSIITAIALFFFESKKWNREQKAAKKAAQVEWASAEKVAKLGLYCEITHHHFLKLDKDKDGSPNYKLVGFQNNFYKDNILDITKFLNEDTRYILAAYYSYLHLAVSYQEEFAKYHSKLEDISEYSPTGWIPMFGKITEWNMLNERRNDFKDILRKTLAPAKKIKHDLLYKLKEAFKNDPSPLEFINVLPEDQEWWQRINKDFKSEYPPK